MSSKAAIVFGEHATHVTSLNCLQRQHVYAILQSCVFVAYANRAVQDPKNIQYARKMMNQAVFKTKFRVMHPPAPLFDKSLYGFQTKNVLARFQKILRLLDHSMGTG